MPLRRNRLPRIRSSNITFTVRIRFSANQIATFIVEIAANRGFARLSLRPAIRSCALPERHPGASRPRECAPTRSGASRLVLGKSTGAKRVAAGRWAQSWACLPTTV